MPNILKLRHAFIPACITGGPVLSSPLFNTIDGRIGILISALGTVMLVAGLSMMLGLIMRQVEFAEEEKGARPN